MTNPTPSPAAGDKKSFKDSLNLPKTAFAMKASLVQNEPASLKRWQAMNLYQKVRDASKGRPPFVLHDGPPYANGNLHLGHLLNRVLKDFVVRSRTLMGFDSAFIPGWDCHGLPIEHKVMSDLQEKGKLAKIAALPDDQRKMVVRKECHAHADKFQKLQRGQMERFLTLADYDHPYLTLQPSFEGATLEVLADLCERGLVYRGLKPVHWSIANETALAEAELEYQDREDLSVYVDFEAVDQDKVYDAFGLTESDDDGGDDEAPVSEESPASKLPKPGTRPMVRPSFMIWTTTPWTLPANLAIAVNPKIEYACVWADGAVTVVAADAVQRVMTKPTGEHKVEHFVVLGVTTGDKLVGLKYRHPFVTATDGVRSPAFTGDLKPAAPIHSLLPADYVTLEDGTGLVHTAPGHGTEDYQTGQATGLPPYCPVKENGTYDASVPDWIRGMSIWDANPKITQHLKDSGHLFYSHKFTHSYPHDWRSKTPVIFRCTYQWFVSVDKDGKNGQPSLRAAGLRATDPQTSAINFVPDWGRNRMRGMLESRPDWCISRQRSWGMPIPAFTLPDGSTFMTAASIRAIAKLVRERGTDVWFQSSPDDLLKHYDPTTDPDAPHSVTSSLRHSVTSFRKGGDILDVWFESGSTWAGCMRERNLGFPTDLYLEGSDQHRGWFQSSLLNSLGAAGVAPFKTLLTHGFIVDKDGKKLSKSRPDAARYEVESLGGEFGMDVMRWWVASLPYENDIKADLELFTLSGQSYVKVRNTIRFLLSNLYDFSPAQSGTGFQPVLSPPTSLDAWALSQYGALATKVSAAYESYDFRTAHQALFDFCNDTLSAVYCAAVKDRLYCDKPDSPRRRQTQAAMHAIADGLCRLLSPLLPHTADEAFRSLHKVDPKDASVCIHLEVARGTGIQPVSLHTGAKADPRWQSVFAGRDAAQAAMEKAKTDPGIENRLDMEVTLPDPDGTLSAFDPTDLADLLGVSRIKLDKSATTPRITDLRNDPRCERSWKRDGTVKPRADGSLLSDRDAAALGLS